MNFKLFVILFCFAGFPNYLFSQTLSFANTLMPEPAKLTAGSGNLQWNGSLTVSTPTFHSARLDNAINRTLRELENKAGTPLSGEVRTGSANATLIVDVKAPGEAVQSLDEDESYSLTITPKQATLRSATVVGAMRGLQTFLQLLQTAPTGYLLPAVQIEDTPRFRWRGLMIDCGRHFEPVDVMKRTLDGMAAVKLNVFHWHLTEDQGFRIESKLYPRLTGMGSDGLFYTQDQARDIVAYAYARGIRVVPEFDMPGHTRSWFVGYPDLASGPGPYTIRREFGVEDAAMDPTRESTYQFIDAFLGEMAQIFPDPYLHIGGDESDGAQWNANPKIQAFMRAHKLVGAPALQAYFNQRLLKIVQKHNKHMVGWDEIFNPALPKDVVIQSWRGAKSLSDAAKQGYQGILSQPYYLDGMKSAKELYLSDPLPSTSELTPDQRNLILGGEICMWGEHVNALSIDSRVWPRSAAIAERLWSPETVTNVDDMYRRLAVESIRLEAAGLTHLSHQDRALRQLTGAEAIEPLRIFASAIEPVSFSDRYQQQHTSQLTPLDNLVDAIPPDPPSRHDINRLTHQFLKAPASSPQAQNTLVTIFHGWRDASPSIQAQLTTSPQLVLAQLRAIQLQQLSIIGLEAVGYLSENNHPPAQWKQHSLDTIAQARQPGALVRFTFLSPLEELVNAVATR